MIIIKLDNCGNIKIRVCVCSLGKSENKYIREFIQHYRDYGVDKIFLYDNNDVGGEYFQDVIYDYLKDDLVKIIDFRGKKGIQRLSLRDCYKKILFFLIGLSSLILMNTFI